MPEGATVTLDLGENTITAGTLEAEGGTFIITNGTVKAELAGNIVAVSGKYSIEVPAAMCGEDMVPVYSAADGLYEVKKVTAYNSVTLTWEGDQPADGFRVEKKIDGVWTEVTTVTEGKYVDKGEPGITNEYRVAPYALYGDNQKEYGKYVTA